MQRTRVHVVDGRAPIATDGRLGNSAEVGAFIYEIAPTGSLVGISPEDSHAVPDPADEVGRSPGGIESVPREAR
jgi:hypothetical protein